MKLSLFLIGAGIVIIVGLLALLYRTRSGIRKLARSGIFYLDSVLVVITVALVIALLMEQRTGPAPSPTPEIIATQVTGPTSSFLPSPTSEPTASPSPSPTATPTPGVITHTVEPGETLVEIAEEYGTTVEALVAANKNTLADPDFLKEGQVLTIPSMGLGTEVTPLASPTALPEPTRIPTIVPLTFTPTPAPTLSPTSTPTSTPLAYPAPVLVSPGNGQWLKVGASFELKWGWEGELAEDEYFDVQVWQKEKGEVPHGIAWKKELSYQVVLSEPGTYYWRVVVIRGKDGQWGADLSPPSEERWFGIDGG